jgi:hypothetical protein
VRYSSLKNPKSLCGTRDIKSSVEQRTRIIEEILSSKTGEADEDQMRAALAKQILGTKIALAPLADKLSGSFTVSLGYPACRSRGDFLIPRIAPLMKLNFEAGSKYRYRDSLHFGKINARASSRNRKHSA